MSANTSRFLWVDFQVRDICMQTCDEDIITTIQSLPRNLPETYMRLLRRIISHGRASIVKRVLEWILVARRPLTLYEMQEIIAIEPCQTFSKPQRVLPNPHRLITWGESLIVLDEEDDVVQYTHGTVAQFLLSGAAETSIHEFSFKEAELNIKAGEICVTYLGFSDFKRALIQRTNESMSTDPCDISETALTQETNWIVRTTTLATKVAFRRHKREYNPPCDVVKRLLSEIGRASNDSLSKQPFLAYASAYWVYHTSSFTRQNLTWHILQSILEILDSEWKDGIIQTPWMYDD